MRQETTCTPPRWFVPCKIDFSVCLCYRTIRNAPHRVRPRPSEVGNLECVSDSPGPGARRATLKSSRITVRFHFREPPAAAPEATARTAALAPEALDPAPALIEIPLEAPSLLNNPKRGSVWENENTAREARGDKFDLP